MDHEEARALAYRCHRALEPLHSFLYFAPEAEQALTGAGLRPGRMGYFASRSAPMGPVTADVVAATFYNFNPDLIAKYIPRAWSLAGPAGIVEARVAAADAGLRRLLGDELVTSSRLAEAAELAREATEACTAEGRPLYAGHAGLDWPSEPHLVFWHAVTLLREYRGDGHIAALVGHGLSGLAALITYTATGKGFLVAAAKATRGWSDEQWDAGCADLREQGLLDDGGALTAEGTVLRDSVEEQTNASAVAPWRHLGAEKAGRLHELGRELSRHAVANGAFPDGVFATPKA
ncbi:hypothetical protein GCM10027445_67740 [Amycolatopsis endophytica]|uniref:SalK n=1 Tax=Amycolatopsis endophytica TaxID=860233 RepID=A0A853AXP6_9PSEU|nr:hypothetical protein [Amycolatopsis endophytica]NYI87394.1 hypothetical protein [Amycolatopsis endophytica]